MQLKVQKISFMFVQKFMVKAAFVLHRLLLSMMVKLSLMKKTQAPKLCGTDLFISFQAQDLL